MIKTKGKLYISLLFGIIFVASIWFCSSDAMAQVYVNDMPAEQINLNTWYSIDTSNSGEWSFTTKYLYLYTTPRNDSKYVMYVRCSQGDIFMKPYYSSNGRWVYDYCAVGASASCSNSEEIWFGCDGYENVANKIVGFDVTINEDDYGYGEGQFMVKEVIGKPSKNRITYLKSKKKRKMTVKFSKAKSASRYQIAYKKKGGKYKYVYSKYRSKTIRGLKSKKYYYVKVRGQRYFNGKYYSGSWSAAKRVKVR